MSTPPRDAHSQATPPTPPFGHCPKCRGEMEYGLMVDGGRNNAIGNRGFEQAAQWVRGRPEKRFWDQAFEAGGADRLEIGTVRCTVCGFLELYALKPQRDGSARG